MSETASTIEITRFQCRHIFTDGRRCASPALRNENFCYYHHTSRKPAPTRASRSKSFTLPIPEDRSAIQQSIGEVLQRIASGQLDPRRAGLLLYGLQIASLNLKSAHPAQPSTDFVTELTLDPALGPLAPPAEMEQPEEEELGTVERLWRQFEKEEEEERLRALAADDSITLQAAADLHPKSRPNSHPLKTLRKNTGEGAIASTSEPHPSPSQPVSTAVPSAASRPTRPSPTPVHPRHQPQTSRYTARDSHQHRDIRNSSPPCAFTANTPVSPCGYTLYFASLRNTSRRYGPSQFQNFKNPTGCGSLRACPPRDALHCTRAINLLRPSTGTFAHCATCRDLCLLTSDRFGFA